MSLLFRYQLVGAPMPVLSTGGRFVHPRPLIPVTLLGPSATVLRLGLLDPGADITVFPESIATQIGLDLTSAPLSSAAGVGMAHMLVRSAELTVRIAQAHERREWKAWIGFTAAALRNPLLGFGGFLQFFDATFRGGLEEVELTINALYPGT